MVRENFDQSDDKPRDRADTLSGQSQGAGFTVAAIGEIDDDDHDPVDEPDSYAGGYGEGSYYDRSMSRDD